MKDSEEAGAEQLREKVDTLQRQLERLNGFIESVRDYAFVTFDLDNRITGWNVGAQSIMGYSEPEVLGLHGDILFTPEDRVANAPLAEIEAARRNGRAEDERWHVRKDGSRFWGSGVLSRLVGEDGVHRGYAKVVRDLTEHKLAEQRLAQSEERFRLFTENVTDYALILVDTNRLISGWNTGAERIFGYEEAEVLGQDFAMFYLPEDVEIDEPEKDFSGALEFGRSQVECWMVRKDGSRFWARWVTTPMYDDRGELRGFAKVLHDETDRKSARERRELEEHLYRSSLESEVRFKGFELDRTREELRDLTASLFRAQEEERERIARELHDDVLQNLAMLEMRVAVLQQLLPGKDRALSELSDLKQNIASLTAGVRTISRRLHPSILEDLGLRIALEKLTGDFERLLNQPVRLECRNLPEELPRDVSGVFYRVAQEALMNVIKHAGTVPVTVTLSGTGGVLSLKVEDSGKGFDPQQARRKQGLGIISMRERASLVGASLRVRSVPGKGTSVEIRFRTGGIYGK